MKRSFLLLTLLIISSLSFAEKGEASRILVHTLNYLSQDYAGAVKNGQIISASEFHEMTEFGESAIKYYKDCSSTWGAADSVAIGVLVYRLDSLVEHHAPFEAVSALAISTRDKVITASGLKITPEKYPSIDNGKIVFKTECVKCHGDGGYGDGPEGLQLSPRPRNLHDEEKIRGLSPFFVFNTVRLGVEGTGMKAHPSLDDEQVWDVAFYVLSIRYQPLKNSPELKSEALKSIVDSLSLEKIATTSDEEFIKQYNLTDTNQLKLTLAAIRYNQAEHNKSDFINVSIKYLDAAMQLYRDGKFKEASQLATLSYLEGIEPLELQLKATDPALLSSLEKQLQHIPQMMEQQKPLIEVNDSVKAAKVSIGQAGDIVNKKEYSFLLAMMLAVSILLREGLEAFLVIMVILSILKASQLKNASAWVHGGWIAAVLVGVVLWFISDTLLKGQRDHLELIEAITSLIAVCMLLYVGFWLHGKSEISKWKDYVKQMMQGAVKSESMFGLAALSFLVVFREVFESVLFLSALNIESAGKQSGAIGLGVLLAFVIVLVLAFLLLQFSAKLPIPKLFKISSLVMGALAVVLVGKGVHSLQETAIVPVHGIPIFSVDLLGIFPTLETSLAQIAMLIVVVVVWRMSGKEKK